MTSQGPGIEILEKLAEWSSEEIESNLDQVLEELMISFKAIKPMEQLVSIILSLGLHKL